MSQHKLKPLKPEVRDEDAFKLFISGVEYQLAMVGAPQEIAVEALRALVAQHVDMLPCVQAELALGDKSLPAINLYPSPGTGLEEQSPYLKLHLGRGLHFVTQVYRAHRSGKWKYKGSVTDLFPVRGHPLAAVTHSVLSRLSPTWDWYTYMWGAEAHLLAQERNTGYVFWLMVDNYVHKRHRLWLEENAS